MEVTVYTKLPRGFYIPTPVREYNPDWDPPRLIRVTSLPDPIEYIPFRNQREHDPE